MLNKSQSTEPDHRKIRFTSEEYAAFDAGDKNFCIVLALCVIYDRPYADCYRLAKFFGREKGRGMKHKDVVRMFEKRSEVVKGPYTIGNKITIKKFLEKHPKGSFFVVVRRHAIAIVDGVVYDDCGTNRRQIISAWRIYPEKLKKA